MNPKNNPKNLELNSKWTSVEPLLGWRHFRIVMRRYRAVDSLSEKLLELELMAACDKNARIWIPASELRSAEHFREGWLKDLDLVNKATARAYAIAEQSHFPSPDAE